jgi:hypothetical protein
MIGGGPDEVGMNPSGAGWMSSTLARRLTILDVMVMVAGTAVGFAGSRTLLSLQRMPSASLGVSALVGSPWVVVVPTLALVPIRLRRPRPDRDHLWRQPGWVACFAVALTLAIGVIQQFLSFVFFFIRRPGAVRGALLWSSFRELSLRLPQQAVFAVAAAWAVLALGGRWSPEKSWIDRLGRLSGLYWIAVPFMSWLVGIMSIR